MPSARGSSRTSRAVAFGNLIRELRRAKDLTQREVAARVPMSAANWSRIENGDQGPPDDEIIRGIAGALDASPDDLIRVAGRIPSDPTSFEQQVLHELRELRTEVREGFARIARERGGPSG